MNEQPQLLPDVAATKRGKHPQRLPINRDLERRTGALCALIWARVEAVARQHGFDAGRWRRVNRPRLREFAQRHDDVAILAAHEAASAARGEPVFMASQLVDWVGAVTPRAARPPLDLGHGDRRPRDGETVAQYHARRGMHEAPPDIAEDPAVEVYGPRAVHA